MFSFFDYEAVIDGAETAAALPSEPAAAVSPGSATEPVPPAGATEAAAAFTPEQIQALQASPEMQEWLGNEASTIAEARFASLLAEARGHEPQTTPGGPQVNINEFLDPMGDNFGQNLLTVLGLVGQRVDQTVNGALAPFTQQAEAVQAAERDELLTSAITDTAATLGGLKGGTLAVQRVIQSVRGQYMPEAMRVYGPTDRAAQVAIDKAVRAELAYQADVAGTAAVQNAEHLATVNGAPAVTAAGATAGVTPLNGDLLRGAAIVQKYGALATAISRS